MAVANRQIKAADLSKMNRKYQQSLMIIKKSFPKLTAEQKELFINAEDLALQVALSAGILYRRGL